MLDGWFQSTLPHREWRSILDGLWGRDHFNPHSRTGSDKRKKQKQKSPSDFNPHSRTGSDKYYIDLLDAADEYFNPHSRTGSDTSLTLVPSLSTNFNPHSRTGSDDMAEKLLRKFQISIHTPAQGVTISPHNHQQIHIFQSTLPHREWRLAERLEDIPINFNPHSRTGSDSIKALLEIRAKISIHTPAQGVT